MSRPIPVEKMVTEFKGHHQNSHIFRVDNFSLLKKYQLQEIESSVFDIGGNKWKLFLQPNGYVDNTKSSYISPYLGIQDYGSLPSNWQVKIKIQIFVLNQFKQDWRLREDTVVYTASNPKWGFPDLISLADFDNPREGYLVGDCALFGVKILGTRGTKAGTADSFALVENPQGNRFSWKMMKFSTLKKNSYYESDEFVTGNRKWAIRIYPQGSTNSVDMLSMYLSRGGLVNSTPDATVYAKFTLKVLDKIKAKHVTNTVSHWFPNINPIPWGFPKFIPLKDLRSPSNYVVNDTLYVQVEINVISMRKYC